MIYDLDCLIRQKTKIIIILNLILIVQVTFRKIGNFITRLSEIRLLKFLQSLDANSSGLFLIERVIIFTECLFNDVWGVKVTPPMSLLLSYLFFKLLARLI